jgi:hypothetical protein
LKRSEPLPPSRVRSLAFAFIQFLPLSLFASYAFWYGAPSNERWVEAFTIGALAAAIQLLIVLSRGRPANRLVLGANLYLLVGGIAATARQWWLLGVYGRLTETGIFLSILTVGVLATLLTPAGFVGVRGANVQAVRWYSAWLLMATLVATAASVAFRGNRTWSAVVPLIGLALLQRVFARRLSAERPLSELPASPERDRR